MRVNGLFFYQISISQPESGRGFNEYGEATSGSEIWSDGIQCQISTNNDALNAQYGDGQHRQSSYTILIEDKGHVNFRRIRLRRGSEDLGEFQVRSTERLSSVGRIRIMV